MSITMPGNVLRKCLSHMALADDHVILLDCPPSLSLLTVNALVASDYCLIPVESGSKYSLARIIHQPEKSTREGPFGGQIILNTTVFQEHHDPKASSSAGLGSVQIGLSVVRRRTSSGQPPWADNHRLTLEPPEVGSALTGPAASGVYTLTMLNSASIPAPPDMTRATQS